LCFSLLFTFQLFNGTNIKDYLQAKNYSNALEVLKKCLMSNEIIMSPEFLKWAHHMITDGELPIEDCGMFRKEPVHIRTTNYIPPMEFEVPDHIDELCKILYWEQINA
jgi:Fic family protein